jgi:HupE / UreJ protein
MPGLQSTKPAMPAMPNINGNNRRRASGTRIQAVPRTVAVGIVALLTLGFSAALEAHGVSGKDAVFLQGLQGQAIGPLLYLGAKHMVTGYDHLLFLVGVIFFLYKLRDVLLYVSLFTIGHSTTLLLGVLGGIHANPFLIDAVIGFSVVYKAFENMDGFKRFFGRQINTRAAVLVFGFFHGFGLATKLQEFALSPNGLVVNIVSFNIGVEIGQFLALTGILIALTYWRTREGFMRHAFATNAIVMACGFLLVGYQLSGYFLPVL